MYSYQITTPSYTIIVPGTTIVEAIRYYTDNVKGSTMSAITKVEKVKN